MLPEMAGKNRGEQRGYKTSPFDLEREQASEKKKPAMACRLMSLSFASFYFT